VRQDERSERTRDLILSAAAGEICRRGFGLSSLSAIVSAANVNAGSVHYHFKTKLAIGAQIIHDEHAQWGEFLRVHQIPSRRGLISLAALGMLVAERALTNTRARAALVLATDRGAAYSGLPPQIPIWKTTVQALLFEAVALGQLRPEAAADEVAEAIVSAFIGYLEIHDCLRSDISEPSVRTASCIATITALRAGGIGDVAEVIEAAAQVADEFLEDRENVPAGNEQFRAYQPEFAAALRLRTLRLDPDGLVANEGVGGV